MSFVKNLNAYLSNPKKMRNKPLEVCQTPNSLLAIGAKPLLVVMNINDVDKCLSARTANKNKNTHDLTVAELNSLPKLLANPVMIFRDSKNSNYITVVSDTFDADGRPFVIGIELNFKKYRDPVHRVATMHGRERAFESFIAKNGKEVYGYITRNIAEGNLIAMNIEKAPEFLQSTGLQLPEGEKIVSFDNSIVNSLASVKRFDKK